jgi:Lon protease-like protein
MRRLPLFPLPVVLFPGAVMPLHIFEPRYRQMVARCLEADKRFGLVYQDPDDERDFEMEGCVGCVAEIIEFQPLPDGRSLLLSAGRERFVVHDGIESGAPYLEALVDEYADDAAGEPPLDHQRLASVELFYRTLRALDCPPESIPSIDRAGDVSFQLAQCIRIDPSWQHRLLLSRTERERLEQLDALFQSILDDPGQADRLQL